MDILAHTLWANYGARFANRGIKKKNQKRVAAAKKPIIPLNVKWTAFWGVFPDLFAFSIPVILMIFSGEFRFGPPRGDFSLAANLYQYSHSLVVWAVVFLIVWAFYKRPRFELFGWALHILIDIPSHAISFFPTPFLFPISEYRFPYGVSWGNHWYMIINYTLLTILFIYLSKTQNKKEVNENNSQNL